jgi:hypothetical protein
MRVRNSARWRLRQKVRRAVETFDARLAKFGLRRLPAAKPIIEYGDAPLVRAD